MKGAGLVKQVEFVYVLMPPSGARVMKKKRIGFLACVQHHCRLHFKGSNRGDCIYGVPMPTYDHSNCWKMSLGFTECSELLSITEVCEGEEAALREAPHCGGRAEP